MTTVAPIAVPCTYTVRFSAFATAGITSVSAPAVVALEDSSTPEPAGTDSVRSTGAGGTLCSRTDTFCCRSLPTDNVATPKITSPSENTLTALVASGTPGALARIVVAPTPTPVTGTWISVCPAGNVAVAGTVAIEVSSLERFTVNPPTFAGADRLSATFCTPPAGISIVAGSSWNSSVSATVTARVSGA